MHALLGAVLAVLTGIEPNYDGSTFSYRLVDYDVPFRSGVRVQTSRELVSQIFYVDGGKLFCIAPEINLEAPFERKDRTFTVTSANISYEVKDIAYTQSLYVLTKETHPRVLSSSGGCTDFQEAAEINALLENEVPLMFGKGATTALITNKRVLVGSDICEFGQNSDDSAMAGSCGYITPENTQQDAGAHLYPI